MATTLLAQPVKHPPASQRPTQEHIETLVGRLIHGDSRVRRQTAIKLAEVGRPALPALLPHLRHERRLVRIVVMRTLVRMGRDAAPAKKQIAALLQGKSVQLGRQAALSLMAMDSNHEPAIRFLLRHPTVEGYQVVCDAWASRGSAGIERLVQLGRSAAANSVVGNQVRHHLEAAVAGGLLNLEALDSVLSLGRKGPCQAVASAFALHGKKGTPHLYRMLQDDDTQVRCAGLAGLAELSAPPPEVVRKLRLALSSSSPIERKAARDALFRFRPELPWLPRAICARLGHKKLAVRRENLAVVRTMDRDLIARVAAELARSGETRERIAAATALGCMRLQEVDLKVCSQLARLLHDPDAKVRAQAAWSASQLAPHASKLLTDLRIRLRDKDAETRANAVLAITCHWDHWEKSGPLAAEVQRLLGDPSRRVRKAAVRAMIVLRFAYKEDLKALADDSVPHHACVGSMSVTPALWRRVFVTTACSDDPELRRQAGRGLCAEGRQGIKLLTELLRHDDRRARHTAVFAFGELGERQHLPKLRPLCKDKAPEVQSLAKQVVKRLEANAGRR